MPPNTTLTSRTASRGSPIGFSLRELCLHHFVTPGCCIARRDHANAFAGQNDAGYLIPSTTRATFPPAFDFLFSFFGDCGATPPKCSFDVPYHRDEARSNIVAQTIFRETECGRATIECVRPGSVIEFQRDADGVRYRPAIRRPKSRSRAWPRFAGAFDAVAHPRPAAAVMFAQFAQQFGAFVVRQRPDIGAAHRGCCDRDAGADVELHAERQSAAALAEIDHAEAVAGADRDRAAGLAHDFFAIRLRTNAERRGWQARHNRATWLQARADTSRSAEPV